MKRTVTLKKNHEFRRLYSKGKSKASPWLVVYCRKNRQEISRIGFTVGTKLGHAVTRNRVRRRLREIYRLNEDRFAPGYDIVVVARVRAAHAEFSELRDSFLKLSRELGLYAPEEETDH